MDIITSLGGYLVYQDTNERVIFYECDPVKNTECDHRMCRCGTSHDDCGFGLCAKTTNPAFRKSGGRSFYAVLKDETYWGREYID